MDWYALLVKPQREKIVHRRLSILGREAFVPVYRARRRWSDRIRELELPLFPGYVFCRLAPGEKSALLNVSGVLSILTTGNTPASIPDSEIAAIQSILRAGMPVRPSPYLEAGTRVRIESGPLRGIGGLLRKVKNTRHLVVTVDLIRRAAIVEIEPAWLRPPEAEGERVHSSRRGATGALALVRDRLDTVPDAFWG